MCKRFDLMNFSTNNSNKSSMIKYNFCFEIWENVDDEIDEQIIDVIFNAFDIDLNAKIEKRDDFDATTERETISVQNICFFDVAKEISKNEIFEIIFDEITNDVDFVVDSFRDKKIAKNVNIAIIVFDDVFANSFDVILTFDVKRSLMITTQKHVDEYSQCFR